MEKIVDLHHDIAFFLILITSFVLYMVTAIVANYQKRRWDTLRVAFAHHTQIEKIWTYLPTLAIISIASPSFSLLYTIDALVEPQITVKVVGHQ